jgi:hypothetical protein
LALAGGWLDNVVFFFCSINIISDAQGKFVIVAIVFVFGFVAFTATS